MPPTDRMSDDDQPTGSFDRPLSKGGATTLILSLLNERPMHGYELIATIRERSGGIFEYSDGTVYPLLYSLRDQGLLTSHRETSDQGRPRKVYRLTPAGEKALKRKLVAWSRFARGMELALANV